MRLLCLLLLSSAALAQQPARPKVAPAYYCASGWRVKYHATPKCRGLLSCNATVKVLPERQRLAERMEPCRLCH